MRTQKLEKKHNLLVHHLKFGVLGTGNYGKKILSKLDCLGKVIWAVNSSSDFAELEIPDWVFIATPNILHYEQAEYFLKAGANVFVEKPATLNPAALKSLIDLAKLEGRLFYVDDVFLYRSDLHLDNPNEIIGSQFTWHKNSAVGEGSLLDRFAYHHLYLLFEVFSGQIVFEMKSCKSNKLDNIEFDAMVNNKLYNFCYSTLGDCVNTHIAFGKNIENAPNDALLDMLSSILRGAALFDENHKRALWVTSQVFNIKKSINKNIGIVGGGIFGTTIAIELASQGYNVVLHERHESILEEASTINQYRVHEGYHYPRSLETALECKASSSSFIRYYRQSIVPKRNGIKHYYAIASQSSKTTPEQYISFIKGIKLPYKKVKPIQGVDLMVEVDESIFDPASLLAIVKRRLNGAGVELRLGKAATEDDLKEFDFTIIATYANLNELSTAKREYQYELCEKPVLKLPDAYRNKSIVIMDGPFMCIDPFGDSDMHVMGNVVHAIHHTNVGYKPIIPDGYAGLINKGVIKNPSITNINKFIETASQFFPNIEQALHIGSMYTIRTVLPGRETDDARPTIVEWIANNRILVFSGKICTSVKAAKTVLNYIRGRTAEDESY